MGKRKNKEKDEEYIKRKIQKLEKKLRNFEGTSPLAQASTPTEEEIFELDKENEAIPEDFMEALGHEGEEVLEVGEPIKQELANRWTKIMSEGLGKEAKELLVKKYPTPSNFTRAKAPIMNAEIKAAASEITLKRDKRICERQNLTGKVLSCLGRSLTCLLKGSFETKKLIEEINDGAKLASEIFYQDTTSRRFFALSGTTQHIKETIKESKADNYLFGEDCAEKIKAAQSIKKTGQNIKPPPSKSSKSSTTKPGNGRGPPQLNRQAYSLRGRGGHRTATTRKYHQSQRSNYQNHRSSHQSKRSHQKHRR